MQKYFALELSGHSLGSRHALTLSSWHLQASFVSVSDLHVPPRHACPALHVLKHVPQCLESSSECAHAFNEALHAM